jgi:hypothetical protein
MRSLSAAAPCGECHASEGWDGPYISSRWDSPVVLDHSAPATLQSLSHPAGDMGSQM